MRTRFVLWVAKCGNVHHDVDDELMFVNMVAGLGMSNSA
jgi:hypothetical protein